MFEGGPFPTLVGVVTTMHEGVVNAAPITWFSPISYDPPLLMISVKKESDTALNIIDNGKFTLQTVAYTYYQQVHNMAKNYPRDVSEAEVQGLTFTKAHVLAVPNLDIAIDWFYCICLQMHMIGDHYQFVGTVEKGGGTFDATAPPLLYLGETEYTFESERRILADRY